jgi:DNA-binding MarR family transcriptional regulator
MKRPSRRLHIGLPDAPAEGVALSRLSSEERDVFEDFLFTAVTVQRRVDQDLFDEASLSLSEYTALRRLSEVDGGRLRMTELATATGLSVSRISRMVRLMEQRGLVSREPALGDRRGWNAVLSVNGRARLHQTERSYAESVRRNLLDHFDPGQLRTLSNLMATIEWKPSA